MSKAVDEDIKKKLMAQQIQLLKQKYLKKSHNSFDQQSPSSDIRKSNDSSKHSQHKPDINQFQTTTTFHSNNKTNQINKQKQITQVSQLANNIKIQPSTTNLDSVHNAKQASNTANKNRQQNCKIVTNILNSNTYGLQNNKTCNNTIIPSKIVTILQIVGKQTKDPFKLWGDYNGYNNNNKQQQYYQQIDDQYSQYKQQQTVGVVMQQQQQQQQQQKTDNNNTIAHTHILLHSHTHTLQMGQLCKKWVISAKQALIMILFTDDYFALKNYRPAKFGIFAGSIDKVSQTRLLPMKLQIQSKNPNFPKLLQQMIEQFIFKLGHPLNQQQKIIAYNIAIQYYTPSSDKLSDVLLLVLLKLGKQYIKIYVEQLINKLQLYLQIIYKYEMYILKSQFEELIQCLIEVLIQKTSFSGKSVQHGQQAIIDNKMIWILMAKPQHVLVHQYLLPKNLSIEQFFAIFCILQPEDAMVSLSLLYLKCINSLTPLFIEHNIIEDIIKHINAIKVPDPLYKPTKSLKLKLIKQADAKKINYSSYKIAEQDKGFMSFLNQKISKVKQKIDIAHKQYQKQQNQSKQKTGVIYNHNTGTYVATNPKNTASATKITDQKTIV